MAHQPSAALPTPPVGKRGGAPWRHALAHAGFDVIGAAPLPRVIAELGPDDWFGQALAAAATNTASYQAVVIGNTRALWPLFVAAYHRSEVLQRAMHPLDMFVEDTLATHLAERPCWFGHRAYHNGYIPLQRLAVACGLGRQTAGLFVRHPCFGPWFALRALVILPKEHLAHDDNTRDEPQYLPTADCTDSACASGCGAAFARALHAGESATWRDWVAVRDACPAGRAFRYGTNQLAYHYTKSREAIQFDS